METLTSSVEASIESGRDTSLFEYTHEYSRDYGLTWIPVPEGMTVGDLKAINNGDIEVRAIQLNSDGTIEKVSDAEDYKVLSCGFGSSGYSPGGVSWIPPDAQQERKVKWRKRFHMKGRKNV